MSKNIPVLWFKDGEVSRPRIPKEGRPTTTAGQRARAVAVTAKAHGRRYFAIRLRRAWQVWEVGEDKPTLEDLSDAAAAMWLQHREGARDG